MNRLTLYVAASISLIAISAGAYPPPEKDEMRLNEFEKQLTALDGKIIEVEFSYAERLKQEGSGEYRIICTVWTNTQGLYQESGIQVYFSGEEAKEFFEEIMEKRRDPLNESASESIYVLVDGKKLTALGQKFKKSKGIYTW